MTAAQAAADHAAPGRAKRVRLLLDLLCDDIVEARIEIADAIRRLNPEVEDAVHNWQQAIDRLEIDAGKLRTAVVALQGSGVI